MEQDRNAFTAPESTAAESESEVPNVTEKMDNEQLTNFFNNLLTSKK